MKNSGQVTLLKLATGGVKTIYQLGTGYRAALFSCARKV